jgi:hypothetical protein
MRQNKDLERRADFVAATSAPIVGHCGVAYPERLLVAMFRQTAEITKRHSSNHRHYRMVQMEVISSFPRQKGVYSTLQVMEQKADIGG